MSHSASVISVRTAKPGDSFFVVYDSQPGRRRWEPAQSAWTQNPGAQPDLLHSGVGAWTDAAVAAAWMTGGGASLRRVDYDANIAVWIAEGALPTVCYLWCDPEVAPLLTSDPEPIATGTSPGPAENWAVVGGDAHLIDVVASRDGARRIAESAARSRRGPKRHPIRYAPVDALGMPTASLVVLR